MVVFAKVKFGWNLLIDLFGLDSQRFLMGKPRPGILRKIWGGLAMESAFLSSSIS
jgi:hypothetical protein